MAKTEKTPKAPRLPSQIDRAIAAAEDKKAVRPRGARPAQGGRLHRLLRDLLRARNARQMRAIADGVMEALAADGVKPAHVEGYDRSEWILLDYFDFIVHIFAPETRVFYSLERLWGNAERIEVAAGRRAMQTADSTRSRLGLRTAVADCGLPDCGRSARRRPPRVVLAPACAACDQPLEQPTAGPVCARCWQSILPLTPPLCDRCGDPLPTWRAVSVPLRALSALPARAAARRPRAARSARTTARCARSSTRSSTTAAARSPRPLGALMRQRGADLLDGAACAVPCRSTRRADGSAASIRRPISRGTSACRWLPALRRVRATADADRPARRAAAPQRPRRVRRDARRARRWTARSSCWSTM